MTEIKLWETDTPDFDPSFGQPEPTLTPMLLSDGQIHGCMLVFPGGGYTHRAFHEGIHVAEKLNSMGFHAFVVNYRLRPYSMQTVFSDAKRAVRFVRYHAKEYGIPEDKIGVMGFSAGGHLTGLLGTLFDAGDPNASDPIDRVSCRPDAIAPCYAALDHYQRRSPAMMQYVSGKEHPLPADLYAVSPTYRVSPATPPCFLWHTGADETVPAELAIEFGQRCIENGVPTSIHVYPFGRHGIGLGIPEAPGAETWPDLLGKFLHHLGF